MKLILTRQVDGLGLAGDIVDVADGYGRNFLVPRGAAIVWTKGAEKQIVQIRRARDAREVRDLSHAQEIKSGLESLSVQLEARAGKDGRLFGSITTTDVANAVKSAGGPLLDRVGCVAGYRLEDARHQTVSIAREQMPQGGRASLHFFQICRRDA